MDEPASFEELFSTISTLASRFTSDGTVLQIVVFSGSVLASSDSLGPKFPLAVPFRLHAYKVNNDHSPSNALLSSCRASGGGVYHVDSDSPLLGSLISKEVHRLVSTHYAPLHATLGFGELEALVAVQPTLMNSVSRVW